MWQYLLKNKTKQDKIEVYSNYSTYLPAPATILSLCIYIKLYYCVYSVFNIIYIIISDNHLFESCFKKFAGLSILNKI
jgi:hypothetical protein